MLPMDERNFYVERQETKMGQFTCPTCRETNEYPVRWIVREKRKEPPRGLNPDDKQRFAKARSYMVRVDEQLACRNIRCRKRFDIPSHQSVVLI